MRAVVICILALAFLPASAQNWALLNPAYKYNYSLGGTDTITNQIFVTHIDTLGPDSFQYDLNRVGVWCDTCPGPQGGAWRTNQPQFLGLRAVVTPTTWVLEWSDQQLTIKTGAVLLEFWLYFPDESVMATVTSVDTGLVLGEPDSIKVLSLSDGGTVTLSREHGLIGMPTAIGSVQAVGIQDLGLGSLIPEVEAFFALMPGDVVQYHTEHHSSNNAYSLSSEFETKYTITDRYEEVDTLVLEYSAIDSGVTSTWYSGSSEEVVHVATMFTGEWRIPSTHYGALGLIRSYPGEVIYFAPDFLGYPDILFCVAEHALDENGRYVVRAKVGNTYVVFGDPGWMVGPDMFAGTYYTYASGQAAEYRIGPGLQKLMYYQSSSGFETNHWSFTELTGSVIAGDTIGAVAPDSAFHVSTQDLEGPSSFQISPNPATDRLYITHHEMIMDMLVTDLVGHILLRQQPLASEALIDTSKLKVGCYLVVVSTAKGPGTRRFIIAR